MGSSIDSSFHCNDLECYGLDCPIKYEEVQQVVLQGYNIVTDCTKSFERRRSDLCRLHKKYQCLINPYYPHLFEFKKDCFGFEYVTLIATVGPFAITVSLYWDITQWVVATTGSCILGYRQCNPFQYAVSKRKCQYDDAKFKLEEKKKEIDCIRSSGKFCCDKGTFVDFRCYPQCKILEPCHGSKVGCEVPLRVWLKGWNVSECGKYYKIYLDDRECHKVHHRNPIYLRLDNVKKGWHTIKVKLFDEKHRSIKSSCSVRVYLCKTCESSSSCDSSSSSSSCDSSSSSSSCDSSSSSSSCDSSSSSSSCDSSSSSSSCDSSSSSSSCDSSSSSSSCDSSSSSSSSSCCNDQYAKDCSSSSSSSSCPSSSSSSSCDSSSSSSSCDSSSSSSSSTAGKCCQYGKQNQLPECDREFYDYLKPNKYLIDEDKRRDKFKVVKISRKDCDSSSSSSSSCDSSSSSSSSSSCPRIRHRYENVYDGLCRKKR